MTNLKSSFLWCAKCTLQNKYSLDEGAFLKDIEHLHAHFDADTRTPDLVIVEDDELLGTALKQYLEKTLDVFVLFFNGPASFLDWIEENEDFATRPFCLVTDISFKDDSDPDGLYLIDILKEKKFTFVSIVMTGFASIESAINATKKGVYHYLTKPFSLEILSELVLKVYKEKFSTQLKPELSPARGMKTVSPESDFPINNFKIVKPTDEDQFFGIIGRSRAMKKVFEKIKKVSQSSSTILIKGPSGTGKELVAQAIHRHSQLTEGPFISVNCGAIPADLLESELFGHEKGAFTGAMSSRKGRFEMAHQGSLFLDEIGDMPLLLQVKLLRVLQSRSIERVGGNQSIPVKVRIITATHRDLDQQVLEGNFREDLFYRLNVIPITLPPLSQRREDIPLLIGHFLSKFVSADGRNGLEFDAESLEILMSYDWPGNVRELENLIERMVILRGGNLIKARDLPSRLITQRARPVFPDMEHISLPEQGIDLKNFLNEIEDSLISQALKKTNGNKNQASKLLSMNRTTLIEKLKKKGTISDLSL